MENKQISTFKLSDDKIIVFRDEDTKEIRVGIADSGKLDDMYYTSLAELKMNVEAIDVLSKYLI